MKQVKSEQGSVLMEFCLMLPVWLLMFGGTFMIFDVSMGRLHLQESNRNLAWLQNDRFDRQHRINEELYRRATLYYDVRNNLEYNMSGEPMWGFGERSNGKKNSKDKNSNPQYWGSTDKDYKGRGIELTANGSVPVISQITGSLLDNNWASLCSGNMELKMEKVSATYIGAIGVSSVLFPAGNGDGTVPLYKSALTFTRSVTVDTKDKKNQPRLLFPNGEMLLLRRKGDDERGKIKDANDMFFDRTIYRSWPSSGTAGTLGIMLGTKI